MFYQARVKVIVRTGFIIRAGFTIRAGVTPGPDLRCRDVDGAR